MTTKRSWKLRYACSSLLCAVGSVHAQNSTNTVLEEIVVTAQKRSENLQDVPVSISAFTSEKRDELGIVNFQDMTDFTPGVQYSGDTVSIRGIGRLTTNVASENGVATYYDGFYTSSNAEGSSSPLLVERTEILRGPQGTLYGRNSIGGAINVISKRPTQTFQGEARVTVASYERTQVAAGVSGPLTDSILYRVSGIKTNQAKGYFTNVSGGPDEGGVENSSYLELQLSTSIGNLDAWLKYGRSKYDNRDRTGTFAGPYETVATPATYTVPSPFWGLLFEHTQLGNVTTNPGQFDNRKFNTNWPARQELHGSYNVTGELIYHFDAMDLKYIGGTRGYVFNSTSDYDSSPVLSYLHPAPNPTNVVVYPNYVTNDDIDRSWSSHELNLTSTKEGKLQWIVGAYFYKEDNDDHFWIPGPDQPQYDPWNVYLGYFSNPVPSPFGANPTRTLYSQEGIVATKTQAVFSQLDFEINEQWKATAGLRYNHDKKTATERTRQGCFAFPVFGCPLNRNVTDWTESILLLDRRNVLFGPESPVGTVGKDGVALTTPGVFENGVVNNATMSPVDGYWVRDLEKSWSAWSGTAGVQWKPEEDTLVYLTYSRGYKAGGFNIGQIQEFPTTDPEFVDAIELGLKTTFWSRLQMNASVFNYAYDDLQALIFISPQGGGPGRSRFTNLKKATSRGLELETVWQATDHLNLNAIYAFLDPKIDDAGGLLTDNNSVTATPEDVTGQRLPNSPKHKFTFNANYVFNFTPGSLLLSGTYVWKDETYYSIFNRPYYLAPSYDRVDLRATWSDASARYSIIGYVRNALNEDQYDSAVGTRQSLGFTTAFIDPTATVGNLVFTRNYHPPRTYGVEFQLRFGDAKK